MPKPDPALLNPSRYPRVQTVVPRYADLDTNNHLNNVALGAMFEDCRARAMAVIAPHAGRDLALMLASYSVQFLSQGHWPEPLEFHAGLLRIGNSSFEIAQLAMQEGRAVALAQTVVVLTDGTRPTPFPEAARRALEGILLRP